MSYYDTIDVDIKRAKEILAKGRAEPDVRFAADRDLPALLASFVAEIERLQPAYRVAARLVGTLQARVEDLEAEVARLDEALHQEEIERDGLAAKVQVLIDWADAHKYLAEHVFTFPDGDVWGSMLKPSASDHD